MPHDKFTQRNSPNASLLGQACLPPPHCRFSVDEQVSLLMRIFVSTVNRKFFTDAKKPSQQFGSGSVSGAHFVAVKPYMLNSFPFEEAVLISDSGVPWASCRYDLLSQKPPDIVIQPQKMNSAPTSSGASSKKIEVMRTGLLNSIHQCTPWHSAVGCDPLQ